MQQFKKGDQLICVNSSRHGFRHYPTAITLGKTYLAQSDETEDQDITIIDDNQSTVSLYKNRFKLWEKKVFGKEDLKSGMLLEFKDGRKSLVLIGTEQGDVFAGNGVQSEEGPQNWGTLEYLDFDTVIKVWSYSGDCNFNGAGFQTTNRTILYEATNYEVKLNDRYSATIHPSLGTVAVGCQSFSFDKVEELYNKIKQHK